MMSQTKKPSLSLRFIIEFEPLAVEDLSIYYAQSRVLVRFSPIIEIFSSLHHLVSKTTGGVVNHHDEAKYQPRQGNECVAEGHVKVTFDPDFGCMEGVMD